MANELAYRYLEQVQAETYDALDIQLQNAQRLPVAKAEMRRIVSEMLAARIRRQPTASEIDSFIEQALGHQQKFMAAAPTRFEEPNAFSIMSIMTERIERVVAAHNVPLSSKPIFGTLSTGRVNAMTIAVPRAGGYLVLLERQLFYFALLISKAVALAFPSAGEDKESVSFSHAPEEVLAHLGRDKSAAQRFRETVIAYATTGMPTNAPQYVVPDHRYQTLSNIFRDALELFVIGHEYGHVIAGHLDSTVRRAGLLPTSVPTEELAYAWEQEYEADYIGAQLSASAMQEATSYGHLCFSGGELFFSAMEIMDKAVSLLQFGDESARTLGSHPPHEYRRESLRAGIRHALAEEEAASLITFGETLQVVLDMLWQESHDSLLQLHRRGVRPARTWTIAQTESPT